MRFKWALSVFVVLALVAGLAFAASEPTGASAADSGNSSWAGATAGGISAQGGNVSNVRISALVQTARWVGFWGAADGSVVLKDLSGDTFYKWTVSNSSGYIFAARNASLDWSILSEDPVNGTAVGTAFGAFLQGTSDSAANTFNESSYAATIAGVTITDGVADSALHMDTTGANTWKQQVLNVSNMDAVVATMAFMCPIDDDAAGYNASTTDFQLLVPEDETDNNAATVYYFYLQLD